MKVVSWILFVLSILVIPVFAIIGALGITEDSMTDLIIIGVVFFFILGFLSHIAIGFSHGEYDTAAKAVFYASFPAFIIPFIAVFLILMFIKFLDWVVYLFTDKHYVLSAVNFILEHALGIKMNKGGSSSSGKSNNEEVVIVQDSVREAKLKFVEKSQDYDPDSATYRQYFDRYRDELGYYWRTYDNGVNFVKEDDLDKLNRGDPLL
ncbi:MAG: hypothetical protein K2L70_06505 [Clostridia bacterium]|nr:hypothetical protein [Clostridia bacterium]